MNSEVITNFDILRKAMAGEFSDHKTRLNSENFVQPDTGMKITQLVLKCDIVQNTKKPAKYYSCLNYNTEIL
jgi:hypothetical protein